jgi:hypothetical protein
MLWMLCVAVEKREEAGVKQKQGEIRGRERSEAGRD